MKSDTTKKYPLNPIGDKIIVTVIDGNDTTDGGVILPDIAQEDTMRATVIAVGPGAIMIDGSYCNMQTKVGDVVIYPKMAAKKVQYKNEEYLALKENDIITILTEENNDE